MFNTIVHASRFLPHLHLHISRRRLTTSTLFTIFFSVKNVTLYGATDVLQLRSARTTVQIACLRSQAQAFVQRRIGQATRPMLNIKKYSTVLKDVLVTVSRVLSATTPCLSYLQILPKRQMVEYLRHSVPSVNRHSSYIATTVDGILQKSGSRLKSRLDLLVRSLSAILPFVGKSCLKM